MRSIYQMLLNTMNASALVHHCSFIHPCKASASDSSDRISRDEHNSLILWSSDCMRAKEKDNNGAEKQCVLL